MIVARCPRYDKHPDYVPDELRGKQYAEAVKARGLHNTEEFQLRQKAGRAIQLRLLKGGRVDEQYEPDHYEGPFQDGYEL